MPPLPDRNRQPSKAMQLVMYPLDWLEERSGLVGGL